MDPLAQLADIQTPEQISQFPMAIGWWLLLALMIIVFTLILLALRKNIKLKKVQKLAIKNLSAPALSITDTTAIIKWAAMFYFPRHEVAKLSGEKLAHYLSAKLPQSRQQIFLDNTLAIWQQQYQKSQTDESNLVFTQHCLVWLKHALPPKPDKSGATK
ncbi:MAG: DUF4381 domain-containing protein [Thalassotalea sp.]